MHASSSGSAMKHRRVLASIVGLLPGSIEPYVLSVLVQPLIDAAEDDDEQTAHAAIRALGSTHNLAALPVLLRWRADPDWNRRVTAYSALGEIDDLESVAAAREGLRDRKPQVRKAAKFALGSIESRRRYKAKMGSK